VQLGALGLLLTVGFLRKIFSTLPLKFHPLLWALIFSGQINSSLWDANDGIFSVLIMGLIVAEHLIGKNYKIDHINSMQHS
jgi:hypothetical protein